jgi:hypothetical protein
LPAPMNPTSATVYTEVCSRGDRGKTVSSVMGSNACPGESQLYWRFLRWILPLKDISFTEEAALPRVPEK